MKRKLTEYTFRTEKIRTPLRFAVAPDIHSSPFEDVMEEFARCDAVLLPGDLVDRHRRNKNSAGDRSGILLRRKSRTKVKDQRGLLPPGTGQQGDASRQREHPL